MLTILQTCTLLGIDGVMIRVEVNLSNGLPGFSIVGLADPSIKEAKERVRLCIQNSGFTFPAKKIVVNLAPAIIKKSGTHFDFSIAVGILIAAEQMEKSTTKKEAFLGECSLNGDIRGVHGCLPMVLSLKAAGIQRVFLSEDNWNECSMVSQIELLPVKNLSEFVDQYSHQENSVPRSSIDKTEKIHYSMLGDFSDIQGQAEAIRAMQIAVAGRHNALMIGGPGVGKTMIANRMPTIMPPLTEEEQIAVMKIHSVAGMPLESIIQGLPPVRMPHHTITKAALVGGGNRIMPGEVSLAHHGVLFLDELPEFDRHTLELLREPIEDHRIRIARSAQSIEFPSNFILIAAMNPCPCGNYGSKYHTCTCSRRERKRYLDHISGPFRDRLDLFIEMEEQLYTIESVKKTVSSAELRTSVNLARQLQSERYVNESIRFNADLSGEELSKYCQLSRDSKRLLQQANRKLRISLRSIVRIQRMARTIADLDQEDEIKEAHLLEAIHYKQNSTRYWGAGE
jgi:magnesium chelatase family protein